MARPPGDTPRGGARSGVTGLRGLGQAERAEESHGPTKPNTANQTRRRARTAEILGISQNNNNTQSAAGRTANRISSGCRRAQASERRAGRRPAGAADAGSAGLGRGRGRPGARITGRRRRRGITTWAGAARRTAAARQSAPCRPAARWRRFGAGSPAALVTWGREQGRSEKRANRHARLTADDKDQSMSACGRDRYA